LKAIVKKIEALTGEPGFIYTLSLILLRDLFFTPEEVADIDWTDRLNFQEITLLVGLLVKKKIDLTIPTEEESAERFERIYQLFLDLHKEHHKYFTEQLADKAKRDPGTEMAEENYRRTFGAGAMMTEPIFYSGSGAYDFQYLDFAIDKYRDDAAWIYERVGVDVFDMCRISRELKRLHEHKYNARAAWPRGNFSELCSAALSVFCFEEKDLQQFGTDTVTAFVNAYSLVCGEANANLELPGQYNQLQSNPIVRLPDGRYFLSVGFNLAESIYETPFYWMNKDRSYSPQALLHRGRFAENVTASLLRTVFGMANVYTDVEIRGKKGHNITDIDVLAVIGNKAVIAQVKSKRLTELARLGDEDKLAADFRLAVQEAYDQGLLSRQALISKANQLFQDGEEIRLSESIDDAYILCVTVDHYPALTHQVDVYLSRNPTDPFPIAVSIFDLDVLAFYLPDPFEFAYYMRQRVALNDYYKADSEMSLLGFHLKHKLFKTNEADIEMLGNSFAQLIDANFPVLRGSVPHTAAADRLHSQWKNEEFQELIDQAKSTGEPKFIDVVFFLYDLAGKGADDLMETLKVTKLKAATDHRSHDARIVLSGSRSGITILSEPTSPLILRKKLLGLARMAKYKSRADVWLALGCLATSNRLVDAMVFSKDKWEADPMLEELAGHLRGRVASPSGKKIGRNEPCPCKSGKKFKYCHGA
jgi:hypothetical protein